MRVFRLAKYIYANDLSGTGSEIAGGRWNFKGSRLLYSSESRALCMAEIAVHAPFGIIPENYFMITIYIPQSIKTENVLAERLPKGWNNFPPIRATQEIGEEFIKTGKALVLKVPSAVVQGDFNYLVNPEHNDFNKIKIVQCEKFDFDERLFT